jgi:ethanolamine permease
MAKDTLKVGGVKYSTAEDGYFEKRSLKRSAGIWGLWGLAIAAVISGDFSGWNFGIDFAGFGGMLIAFVVVIIMYFALIYSVGEMAAAMPHTGGAYSFARSAMGPWGGFVTGVAETIEYVATTAVIVFFSASYADSIAATLFNVNLEDGAHVLPMWVWYVVLYAVFIVINWIGASLSFKFSIWVSFISIAILVVFFAMTLFTGSFHWDSLWNIKPDAGASTFLPHGVLPILFAVPFAMWFFLGIEELPLAAEEAHNPSKDIPKAGRTALLTLVIFAVLVLVLNTGVNGAESTGKAGEPLLDGFRAILGDGGAQLAAVLSLFALIGLLASLQGIMFAYGRNMYSLSRAGYYPKFFSLTGKRQTPWVSLLIGAAIGFVALVVVDYLVATDENAGATGGAIVLNIAVWGAVISYLMQMISFIILRARFKNANRPYRSPWGVPGAVIAAVVSVLIFLGFLFNPAFTPAIIAIAVVYVVLLAGFALFGRNRLILSPEEEYALSGGQHGDPEKEGYGGKVEAEILAQDGVDPQ